MTTRRAFQVHYGTLAARVTDRSLRAYPVQLLTPFLCVDYAQSRYVNSAAGFEERVPSLLPGLQSFIFQSQSDLSIRQMDILVGQCGASHGTGCSGATLWRVVSSYES